MHSSVSNSIGFIALFQCKLNANSPGCLQKSLPKFFRLLAWQVFLTEKGLNEITSSQWTKEIQFKLFFPFSWKSDLNALIPHASSRFIHESQLNALYVVFIWTNTYKKKNHFHYLDRCMFVSIWKYINPVSYKYSVTL